MKKHCLSLFLLLFLFGSLLSQAYAQNYYVSALTGSDDNDGLTPEKPLSTIQKGADLVNPGGTVFIMNGTYNETGSQKEVLKFTRSGTADAYITFKPYPGHNPIITATGGAWNSTVIDGSYVILDGLEFAGVNATLTLADAEASYLSSYGTPRVFNATYNTNAISIGETSTSTSTPHHVIVRNCKVHDFPGGGIGVGAADYITIEDNIVYNNSWYTMYATSGISIFGPKPIDNYTGYKIFVRRNTVYNNYTQVKWRRGVQANDKYSDGNGIILDANNGTQNKPVYTGRTLVESNVSYNNGGGGVHSFQAARVDIINNTTYSNGKKVGYPEISAEQGQDVKIYNNIMYARTGGNCNGNDPGAIYDYNIYYNGPAFRQGPHDIVADPQFVNLSQDPATADFRLQATSPAINSGSQEYFSAKDITGLARPQGSRPERGAYEYQSGSQAQTITFAAIADKALGAPDFNPGATASSGLPVIYRSSNISVATIVDGKVQLVGGGTATITATQGGNDTYAEAPEVSHAFTVTAAGFGNVINNGTFDANTTGWDISSTAPYTATIASVANNGYSSNVLEATVTNTAGRTGQGGPWDVQLRTGAPLVAGRTYVFKFKASADVPATIDVLLQANKSPWTTYKPFWAISITTTPRQYSYTYTATTTDETTLLKFMIGKFNGSKIYIDDVEITSVPAPNMNIKQGTTHIARNTGSYNFGEVTYRSPKTVSFTIENTGDRSLNFVQAQKISVTGKGFSLSSNVPSPAIDAGGNATFEVTFTPDGSGSFSGNISIANDDPAKNPYNFSITGTGVKADQAITFTDGKPLIYGDGPVKLAAVANSGLAVAYAVISGPGQITDGNILTYTGVGEIVVEASQAGTNAYHAAAPVQQTFAINQKELLVKADDKTLTYGDPAPAYTYTLSGFAFGETAAVISGSPVLSSTYTSATPATETPAITVSLGTLNALNYSFTAVNGKLSIQHTFPLLLEAEEALVSGGKVMSIFEGYTGEGYVTKINKSQNSIQWSANVSGAGMSTLVFRYASDVSSQNLVLTVNGKVVKAKLNFAFTGDWRNWSTVSVPAYLNAGINTITLSGSGSAGPNIDHLVIESNFGNSTARSSFEGQESQLGKQPSYGLAGSIKVYPVPASNDVNVSMEAPLGEAITISVVDIQGRIHLSKSYQATQEGINTIAIDLEPVPSGTYFIRATTAQGSESKMIAIFK